MDALKSSANPTSEKFKSSIPGWQFFATDWGAQAKVVSALIQKLEHSPKCRADNLATVIEDNTLLRSSQVLRRGLLTVLIEKRYEKQKNWQELFARDLSEQMSFLAFYKREERLTHTLKPSIVYI